MVRVWVAGRQNVVVYAHMLTYNNCAVASKSWQRRNRKLNFHYRQLSSNTHKYMLESINFTNNLNKTKNKPRTT